MNIVPNLAKFNSYSVAIVEKNGLNILDVLQKKLN